MKMDYLIPRDTKVSARCLLSTPDRSSSQEEEGILGAIGNTPLVRFSRFLPHSDIRLFGKLEAANPGGSAKDRPALRMLTKAIEKGLVTPNSTIIESSSGNMGIGLAQVCAYHRLTFRCVVDPMALPGNVAIMKAYGAEIELVQEPVDGDFLKARLARIKYLLDTTPGAYWPNQYANPGNPGSHLEGTIREIDEELNGEIDYLFVATSSTGTAGGCREYLRRRARKTRVVAVDATGSVLFGGKKAPRKIPGLGAGIVSPLARGQTFEKVMRVSDIDCVVGCRQMARDEAVLCGGSGGGVLHSIRSFADRLRGKTCVAILHDSGTRYLDTVYNDEWVESVLKVEPAELARLVGEGTNTNTSNELVR